MTEWDGEGLDALAPEVDLSAARQAFARGRVRAKRQRRITAVAAVALVVAVTSAGVQFARSPERRVDVDIADASFDVENASWSEEGVVPDLRTGAAMVVGPEGRVIVWGGTTHEPSEREPERGAGYPPGYKGYTGDERVDGVMFDPRTKAWETIPDAPVPFMGFEVTAVWTSSELLVFGIDYGSAGPGTTKNVGAAFDPATKKWRTIALPPRLYLGEGVWTGRELVVIGTGSGTDFRVRAAAYDPAADRWREFPDLPFRNAPALPWGVLAWTGSEVIAGDGQPGRHLLSLLDPNAGAWRSTSPSPIAERHGSTFGWTGSHVLQLRGGWLDGDVVRDEGGGAVYDVARDEWELLDEDAPAGALGTPIGDGALFFRGRQLWFYDNSSRTWTRQDDAPVTPSSLSAVASRSELWALSGEAADPGEALKPVRLLRYGS